MNCSVTQCILKFTPLQGDINIRISNFMKYKRILKQNIGKGKNINPIIDIQIYPGNLLSCYLPIYPSLKDKI